MSNRKKFCIAILVLILCFLISLTIGRYNLKISTILYLVELKLTNRPISHELTSPYIVLWVTRLPRAIMAVLVGVGLTLAGTVFQGLFRNPLVSPDILGVSYGASFGAAAAILFLGNSVLAIQSSTFIVALFAVFLACELSRRSKNQSITTLVLAGIIISSLFSAGLSFLKYISDPFQQLPEIEFWTMGSFNTSSWGSVIKTFSTMFLGLGFIFLFRWKLNVLSLGDDEALSLGVDVKKARRIYILSATLLVASSISSCGVINWVGLVVPHIARMIIGSDHNVLIPFSAVIGGSFMLIMDTIARSLTVDEIPISIITSFVGAPFLAYLLVRQNKNSWND